MGKNAGRFGRRRCRSGDRESGTSLLAAALTDVAADQRPTELMDFLKEVVQTTIFEQPCLHLRKKVLGNVDRAGTTAVFEGELVGAVFGTTVVTTAAGIATPSADGTQGASEQRLRGREPFEPGLKHASDQGGMLGNAHHGISVG